MIVNLTVYTFPCSKTSVVCAINEYQFPPATTLPVASDVPVPHGLSDQLSDSLLRVHLVFSFTKFVPSSTISSGTTTVFVTAFDNEPSFTVLTLILWVPSATPVNWPFPAFTFSAASLPST